MILFLPLLTPEVVATVTLMSIVRVFKQSSSDGLVSRRHAGQSWMQCARALVIVEFELVDSDPNTCCLTTSFLEATSIDYLGDGQVDPCLAYLSGLEHFEAACRKEEEVHLETDCNLMAEQCLHSFEVSFDGELDLSCEQYHILLS